MKAPASLISRFKKVHQRAVGFSMIELLVVLAIMSIFCGAVYRMFASINRSYTTQSVASGTQQRVRAALDFMVRDIRMAGLDPLRTAGAGIITATATTLRFTADKNLDGDVTDAAEDITYNVAGGSLQLTDDQGTETLTENVSNFAFTYFDQDGAITATVADIRLVAISMTLQDPAGRGQAVSRNYSTRVRCRNIGL